MGKIHLAEESFPSAPAAGFAKGWFDSGDGQWYQRLDNGLFAGDTAKATIAQIAAHSADTYYCGIQLPSFSMQAGMTVEWEFPVTKTAGVAGPVYTIRTGSGQAITDTSRLVLTGPAQTAVADTGWVKVRGVVRVVSGVGTIHGWVWLQHNLAATGLANTPAGFSLVQGLSGTFDNTALGGLYLGLSVNPGASAAWVVEQVTQRIWV